MFHYAAVFFSFHRITFFFLLFIFVMLSVDWHHPFSRRIMDLFGDNGPSIFFIISLRCYKMLQYYSHPYYFPSFLVNLVQLIVSQSYIIPLLRICESRNYSRSNFSWFPISFLFILKRVFFLLLLDRQLFLTPLCLKYSRKYLLPIILQRGLLFEKKLFLEAKNFSLLMKS